MTIEYCDVCGKPLYDSEHGYSRYKLKKQIWSFGESWWERLAIHDDCWKELCKQIKEKHDKV